MKKLAQIGLFRFLHDRIVYPSYIGRNKRIFSRIKKPELKNSKIALFLTVRTLVKNPQTYLESTVAHALEASGLRVLMLYCDNVLDSCDAETHATLKTRKILCGRCKSHRKALIRSLGLEYCSYGGFLTHRRMEDIRKAVYSSRDFQGLKNMKWHGVAVAEHAMASVIRYFLTHSFDENNPEQVEIFKAKLTQACLSAELAHRIYETYGGQIAHILTVHGVYATWGPFYDYFRARNVDSIIYSLGIIHPGSIAFHRNGHEWDMFYPKSWEQLKTRDLTPQESGKVDDYINRRFFKNLGIDLQLYGEVAAGKKKEVLAGLDKKSYPYRFIFYTHMIWDSVLEKQSAAFKGFADMFDRTMEYFLKHTDKQLIIKIHPAELVWEKGSYSMMDYIKAHFPRLTENIVILPPSTPVTSYEIVNKQTIGLTYVGSVGYELSAIGVPVLVGGFIHYLNEGGVGVGINSLEQYYALLDDPTPAFQAARDNREMAKKWCYYFYYMLHFDFPFYAKDRYAKVDWEQIKKLPSTLEDPHSSLRRMGEKIRNHEDIVNNCHE
ncbi:MAG: hypothetical protein WC732_05005 [Candidatus Omnitrophota bacterium]